jgi:hypothetical protein
MPLLLLVCYFNVLPHPQQDVPSVVKEQCASIASADAWTYGSALVSVIISTSAFSSQKLMSGAAFVTLNSINKIPGILVSNLVFGVVLNFPMIVGLSLSLFSGFLFDLFSDTKKSLSNFTIFQASLVFFAIANTCLYSGFNQPLPLELIGPLAPAAIKALPALLWSILILCSTSNAESFRRPASFSSWFGISLAFGAFRDFALELTDIAETSESLKSQLFMVGMTFSAAAQWFLNTAFSPNNVPRLVSRVFFYTYYALVFSIIFVIFVMDDGINKKIDVAAFGIAFAMIAYTLYSHRMPAVAATNSDTVASSASMVDAALSFVAALQSTPHGGTDACNS